MRKIAAAAVWLPWLLCVSACGGGGGDPAPPLQEPPPQAPSPPPPTVTFTVGGTVAGLQGSTLVLRSAGEDLTVSANGAFRFPSGLSDGATYDVTVAVQPSQPTQLCSLSGGQGRIDGADVTDIVVHCRGVFEFLSAVPADGAEEVTRSVQPMLTFSAQLDAASVVAGLATLTSDGGGETIDLGASGSVLSLTPTSRLLPLTDYTLQVADTLLAEDGARLAAPVRLSFRTRDGAWGIQEALTGTDVSSGGLNVNGSRIVADAAGRTTAIWTNERGLLFKRELWARHRSAEGPWQPAVRIDDSDLEDVGDLAFAADDSGAVLAAWAQTQGGLGGAFNRIFAKRFTPAGGWEPAQLVATGGDHTQLQLSMHGDGSAMLVWYETDTGSNAIMANRFAPATGWAQAQRIDTASSVVFQPRIAVMDGGAAIAVWEQYIQGAGNDIFAARFDAAAGWDAPVRVSVTNNGIAINPSLAASADGAAVVSWQQGIGLVRYTASSYYTAGQGWGAPVRIETGSGNSDQAQVAMDASGAALAVWRQTISGTIHVHASRRDQATGAWDAPVRISNVAASAAAFHPSVKFDRRGNALAVWYELAIPQYRVHGNRFTPEHGWGGAEGIGEPDAFISPFSLSLTIDGSGSAWAAWTQQDSNRVPRVLVNRFE